MLDCIEYHLNYVNKIVAFAMRINKIKMDFKKLIEITIKLIIVIFLLVMLLYFFAFFDDNHDKNKCLKKKEMEFAEVINDILDDTINRKQKLIVLKNGLKIETYYTNGIWSSLKIGDSIVKKRGTFRFKVYSDDKIFLLDFALDCE